MLTAILVVLGFIFFFVFGIGLFMGFAASMADGQVGLDEVIGAKQVMMIGAAGFVVVVGVIGLWRALA